MLRTTVLGGLLLALSSPYALSQSASVPDHANGAAAVRHVGSRADFPAAGDSEPTLAFTGRRRHVVLLLEDLELGPRGNAGVDCSGEAPFELIFGCQTDDRDFDPGLRHYTPDR
ncbi:MAG: hypothetical protein JOY64_21580 [Alphaproteobacteria bacterium]|nr:hypothetical protein [Alphaproteobacteria bacterium]MBV8410235.1 hypothetical protein [Alphaproteobacteria bacterium]